MRIYNTDEENWFQGRWFYVPIYTRRFETIICRLLCTRCIFFLSNVSIERLFLLTSFWKLVFCIYVGIYLNSSRPIRKCEFYYNENDFPYTNHAHKNVIGSRNYYYYSFYFCLDRNLHILQLYSIQLAFLICFRSVL